MDQQAVGRTGLRDWIFAKWSGAGSSCPEAGIGSDGPRGTGFDREHLHLRPVVWELTTTIEANNVCPGYGGRSSAAPQFAANGDGEAATFVPTTEDPIEKTHQSFLIGPGSLRTSHISRARAANTNRLHQAGTQSRRQAESFPGSY